MCYSDIADGQSQREMTGCERLKKNLTRVSPLDLHRKSQQRLKDTKTQKYQHELKHRRRPNDIWNLYFDQLNILV